ncbi:radical SAM protein [Thermococcus sp.]
MKIRISYGTAISMGLIHAKMLAKPITAYFMTYHEGRCRNNCAFCPQARESRADLKKLSRITWPVFELETVTEKVKTGGFARICLQTIDYPDLVSDVLTILETFQPLGLPVSVSITPVEEAVLKRFKELGVDYIGIGLDVASERLYPKIKDSLYSWEDMWRFTEESIEVFGKGKAFVHIIIGLGENDREVIETIQRVYDIGAEVSLFAFTPIKGTRLENLNPPPLERYRKIQIALYLIRKGITHLEDIKFREDGSLISFGVGKEKLREILKDEAFRTYGCPGCNRPYYNERPQREPYNFPFNPGKNYVLEVLDSLGLR